MQAERRPGPEVRERSRDGQTWTGSGAVKKAEHRMWKAGRVVRVTPEWPGQLGGGWGHLLSQSPEEGEPVW